MSSRRRDSIRSSIDTIDYVKSATANPYLPANCPTNIWCADNLNGLHFAGVETSFTWIPKKSQKVRIEWTALHGAQTALHGLESEYVFNYPVENIHASWSWAMGHDIVLDEFGAACPAISADGLSGVGCDADARMRGRCGRICDS